MKQCFSGDRISGSKWNEPMIGPAYCLNDLLARWGEGEPWKCPADSLVDETELKVSEEHGS